MPAPTLPIVVALVGLPGAGKSAVAERLVRALPLRLVSRDAIRAAMFPECRYTLAEKRAAFRSVLTALEVNAALGASSIVDGMTFSRRRDLDRVAEACRRHGSALLAIWLDVPPHVARARVADDRARGLHVAADRVPALVDAVQRRFEPPPADAPAIDAAQPLDEVVRAAYALVAAAIGAAHPPDPGSAPA